MTEHNHKMPNFGRTVEGCPRCEEIQVAKQTEAVEPTPQATPEVAAPVAPLSADDLIRFLREARKGTPEEEADKEAAKLKRENSKAMLRKAIEEGEALKRATQDACGHRKYDPVMNLDRGPAIVWNRHAPQKNETGDGFLPPVATGICLRCLKEFGPEPAHLHPESGGVVQGISYGEAVPA